MSGRVPVADSFFKPEDLEYGETRASIVPYAYDPRRALDLLGGIGFHRDPAGALLDPGGQRLAMDVRAYTTREIHPKALLPVVSFWQQNGIAAEPDIRPAQAGTPEDQSTFPSFLVLRQPTGITRIQGLLISQARLPENRYVGSNNGRYMNAEVDALAQRFFTTIPRTERMAIAGQILNHVTENLPMLPLFYDAQAVLLANRAMNVPALAQTWNAHQWDVSQ
jgi:peptide/nickel transport system substrate-binding protein